MVCVKGFRGFCEGPDRMHLDGGHCIGRYWLRGDSSGSRIWRGGVATTSCAKTECDHFWVEQTLCNIALEGRLTVLLSNPFVTLPDQGYEHGQHLESSRAILARLRHPFYILSSTVLGVSLTHSHCNTILAVVEYVHLGMAYKICFLNTDP
ncbi:uncharacterized protein [Physcomitrium patens]|uniref:uncharacterized protein isoform X4 n=1 Tax=Physcomitrium patens TaxID=3218 RepID=UPI000D16C32C|nr:uncharacterized protein LOC112281010 isoform X4 [Physcomitrium patens]|eukprot:XP_024372876.1 uncharacterized protein LOC112281010 isoform X4 [Physcomitrella patens]